MIISDSLNEFIEDKVLCGLSSKTITCYKEFVGYFIKFLGNDFLIDDLSETCVKKYIAFILDKDLSVNTKATYIRHLKIFLKWLESCYDIDIKAKCIKVPKTTKKHLYIYSQEDIVLIFQSIRCNPAWVTVRNQCIIALMLDSGLRQSEVCNLHYKDFVFKNSIVKVKGKGNKERFVSFGNTTKSFLQKYIKACPFDTKDYLFLTSSGKPITTNTIKMLVYKLNNRLPFEVSSHKLRHNFATNYILDQYKERGDVDIYQLKSLMGHSDIETTENYLHIANEFIASNNSISHLDCFFDKEIAKKVSI